MHARITGGLTYARGFGSEDDHCARSDVGVVHVQGVVHVEFGVANQKGVGKTGYWFIIIECIGCQQVGNKDVDEHDIAISMDGHLEINTDTFNEANCVMPSIATMR